MPHTSNEIMHPFIVHPAREKKVLAATSLLRISRWRIALLSAGVIALLCSAILVHAQTNGNTTSVDKSTPVMHTITAPGKVPVRSGGSDRYYITGYVNRGDRVIVVGESKKYPGWLAIKPPTGSYSWINSLLVKRYGRFVGAVCADNPVPTRIGSDFYAEHGKKIPNVENTKRLARGTCLVLLDEKPVITDDGSWLAIAPTPGEVRYIPTSAIRGSQPQSVPPPPTGVGSAGDVLARAERALQNRQYCKSLQLCHDALKRSPTYQQQIRCYNMIDELKKAGADATACRIQPGHPQHASLQQNANPVHLTSRRVVRYQAKNPQPASQTLTALPRLEPSAPAWSKWGILRRTSFRHGNGQPMYVLTDSRGNPLTYAVTTPDMTLEPYVGRQICLFGKRGYRSDRYFRNHYVMVTTVALP